MKKEILLSKKKKCIINAPWYVQDIISDDDLQRFSLKQLEAICKLTERAENYREKCNPFFVLSATEIIQKETGNIVRVEDDNVKLVDEDYILNGAACEVYQKLIKNKGN